MNRLEELARTRDDVESFARGYMDYLAEVLERVDESEVAAFIGTLLDARERGARIFFMGNGGSAATATHFANDIAIGSKSWEKPFKASSLSDNVSSITAIANDDGYAEIFEQQLRVLMSSGDVVVAISASGNSPNVVRAVEYANANGAVTAALTGFDGGELKRISRLGIHVPTAKGEYGPVEDVHLVLDHVVSSYLLYVLARPLEVRGAR
ncbi:MAG: SIS domain-containing protein [Gemmatimonadetes bacterium]|nr:SIS domain-containing protein [Gemmatimonadota bacterium]